MYTEGIIARSDFVMDSCANHSLQQAYIDSAARILLKMGRKRKYTGKQEGTQLKNMWSTIASLSLKLPQHNLIIVAYA